MKVLPSTIKARMSKLKFETWRVPGTNMTIAVAVEPDGFALATGVSSCVDKKEFSIVTGKKVAIENAKKNAEDKLWEYEGYMLKQILDKKVIEINKAK